MKLVNHMMFGLRGLYDPEFLRTLQQLKGKTIAKKNKFNRVLNYLTVY